jgi:hypothetical protein
MGWQAYESGQDEAARLLFPPVHGNDLLYDVKLARIRAAYQQMQAHPTRVVVLYTDEHLVGRYPTVARCYSSTGFPGMQAHQHADAEVLYIALHCKLVRARSSCCFSHPTHRGPTRLRRYGCGSMRT